MEALLINILCKSRDPDNRDSVRELIIYGRTLERIIYAQDTIIDKYVSSTKYKGWEIIYKGSWKIDILIKSDQTPLQFSWNELEKRIAEQRINRPRGDGCIFRGGSVEGYYMDNPKEYIKDQIDYLEHAISEQKKSNVKASYIYIGSLWDKKVQSRIGKPVLIEAPSIQYASEISDYYFLSSHPQTTLTDWCGPIYEALR